MASVLLLCHPDAPAAEPSLVRLPYVLSAAGQPALVLPDFLILFSTEGSKKEERGACAGNLTSGRRHFLGFTLREENLIPGRQGFPLL